jgi:tRNA A37 threonylcarbamoyladenosine dehydratase
MPSDSSPSPDRPRQFERTVDFLGDDGFARLQQARVAVVGLGGVGSHAAFALARSGVGGLRLIDFDDVTWSSLNRHAVAVTTDMGRPKVEVVASRLREVNPAIELDLRREFFHLDTAASLLAEPLDCVVDAIDSESPKVRLLEYCARNGLTVVSSMGASSRRDPTKLRVADISRTEVCPLARNVRTKLRKLGVQTGITAVYSVEKPAPPLPPDPSDDVLSRGRPRRRLPSMAPIPGIVGYVLAALAIDRLATSPPPTSNEDSM